MKQPLLQTCTERAGTVLSPGIACLLLLLTACGLTPNQRGGVASFTVATTSLADGMAENFVRTRDDVIELRSSMLELGSGSVVLETPETDLDGPLDVGEVDRRLKAAIALKRYAELLDALVTDTQTARLQAASERFLGGLTSIQGVNLPPEKADAISAAIVKVGGLWVEHKRKVAVKRVVLETRPVLRRLAELVAEDFDPQQPFWVGVVTATHTSITDTMKDQSVDVVAGETMGDDENGPKWTEAGVALWHARYQALVVDAGERVANSEQLSAQIHESVARFLQAHDELCALMQAPDFRLENVPAYVAEVEELARLGKILTQGERK